MKIVAFIDHVLKSLDEGMSQESYNNMMEIISTCLSESEKARIGRVIGKPYISINTGRVYLDRYSAMRVEKTC